MLSCSACAKSRGDSSNYAVAFLSIEIIECNSRKDCPAGCQLLLDRVEVVADQLVHLEHVDGALLEDGLHAVVTAYLALVGGVLQVVGLDVLPQLLDDLWAG